jgi:hypothetical protein
MPTAEELKWRGPSTEVLPLLTDLSKNLVEKVQHVKRYFMLGEDRLPKAVYALELAIGEFHAAASAEVRRLQNTYHAPHGRVPREFGNEAVLEGLPENDWKV